MTEPDAHDRLLATLDGAWERATDARQEDLRLTSRWNPESLRVVYLFGNAYWWDADADGHLTLQPTAWINAPALHERRASARRRPGTGPE